MQEYFAGDLVSLTDEHTIDYELDKPFEVVEFIEDACGMGCCSAYEVRHPVTKEIESFAPVQLELFKRKEER